ncbi:Hypothetical protein DHA2_151979 [Giardia duodenalis]|uniref:Uncharacterized protein n=1 Tax=Giardia intestinalis TaxID=5741 RepID=V6TEW4_GIAIN|nr:Hypothetical protein DHA2_151979 [Giardia intestinalis]
MQKALLTSHPPDEAPHTETIEAMVASDDIEGLLAHTDLFFEVRCRTEELIQYLKQKKTLHRLLDFIFFAGSTETAEQALQLIRSCENINEVMAPIVDDTSILDLPFHALQSFSDQIRAELRRPNTLLYSPTILPKHLISRSAHVCEAFSKVIKSIMWTGRRFCAVLSFLKTNSKYLHTWLQFLYDASMADAFRYLFYDSTTRCQSAIDAIRDLATCSNIFDLLVEYILHPDSPQDYLLSASDILCKVLVREIPGVSQPVLAYVPRISTHIIRHRFIDDTTHWQIQPLSEIVLCAMSYMSVKMLQCYRATSPDALASVPAAILNERHSQFNSLLGVELDRNVLISTIPDSDYMLDTANPGVTLTPLGLPTIDDYEQGIYKIYFCILSAFNNWDAQLELLQKNNGREIPLGAVLLFRLAARILSISADVRNSLVPDEPPKYYTSNNVQITSPYSYSVDNFSRLPESGHHVSSGNIKVPLRDIIYCGGIPVHVGVLSIVKKVVALKLHIISISCISKFPASTVVHFCALQILQSTLQYGREMPEVTIAVATEPSIMLRFETASYGVYSEFNKRSSSLSHLVQLARYLLRLCFGISDQMDLKYKMQYLENGKLSNLPCDMHEMPELVWKHGIYPTSLSAALRLAQELSTSGEDGKIVYNELLDALSSSPGFVKFSEVFLEKDETTPTVFSDGTKHVSTISNTDSILS